MDSWSYVWLGGLALLLVAYGVRAHQRNRAIRALASRRGFLYLGSTLPQSVDLTGTELAYISAVWNVIDGESNGRRVVVFDCRIGHGKASRRRTVFAAESPDDVFGIVPFQRDLTVERSSRWSFLYQRERSSLIPQGIVSLPEIEAHLDAMEAAAAN